MKTHHCIIAALVFATACAPTDSTPYEIGGACNPGETAECYTGPDGTVTVGQCNYGIATCGQDGIWGQCELQVLPSAEVCGDRIDNDCNGETDENTDLDGDGYTTCDGDCCDSPVQGCNAPELVNPGAFDSTTNGFDDDCDGVIDNPPGDCDSGLASNSSVPEDYAKAMGICSPPLDIDRPVATWGLVSADILRPDGSPSPAADSRAIRPSFGSGTPALQGEVLAMLSTGVAAAPGDINPNYPDFVSPLGNNMNTSSNFPQDWQFANGGELPNVDGCPAPGGQFANDSIMLQFDIRVPSNARSFSFQANLLSAEYPEYVCSPYNDFFVVLLDSDYQGEPANPVDKNLARFIDDDGVSYPVGVNLAFGTGLFRQCVNGPTGCTSLAMPGNNTSCVGIENLAGTTLDEAAPGSCDANGIAAAARAGFGWLATLSLAKSLPCGSRFGIRAIATSTPTSFSMPSSGPPSRPSLVRPLIDRRLVVG